MAFDSNSDTWSSTRTHRHLLVRRDGQEPVRPVVAVDMAELEVDFFSRSTIAARCTQGQVLKLTSRYFAIADKLLCTLKQ